MPFLHGRLGAGVWGRTLDGSGMPPAGVMRDPGMPRWRRPVGVASPEGTPGGRSPLGDFTADRRMVYLSALALIVGALGAVVTIVLLGLIGLITNLAYYQRWSFKLTSPADNQLGWLAALIPIVGGLIVGLMARYGSERIRGHGIPEAMETILVGGSKIEPKLLLFKPTSSAIAIGTGGPFGAEGPIILTGGALGSVIGQLFQLSAAERKTLLVAGAAAGMAGIFNAPIASVLLAVELLLFEFKPRSLVPVALAAATATVLRRIWLGNHLMFPMGAHPAPDTAIVIAAVVVGLLAGALAWLLTLGIYGAEDLYRKLPLHWMWWPALGGVVVGVGGVIFPLALGVGYSTISDELAGHLAFGVLLGIFVFKSLLWIAALSSGTSGGILAPVLLIGGAMGGMLSGVLPSHSAGLWALIAMAATLAALMDAPLMGVVFAIETSGALDMALPLLAACATAYAVVVLVLKRSILTEKVARRGYHISREYAIDPLEVLTAHEVMQPEVVTLADELPLTALRQQTFGASGAKARRLYPVVDKDGLLVGVLTRTDLAGIALAAEGEQRRVRDIMRPAVVAYPDETLRTIAARMITSGVWRVPVVSRENPRQVVGMLSQRELLRAREHLMEEERHREGLFRLRMLAPRRPRAATDTSPADASPVPGEPIAAAPEGAESAESAGPQSTLVPQAGALTTGDEPARDDD
ncbi:MAG: chloride channel protein [Ktedonobacterales bacterium]